jgi:uncharacterized membrane protein
MNENQQNWKWGIFYFNPEDKRLFVLKKLPGMGLTLNFANPASFLIIALIIVFLVASVKLS